MSEFETVDSGKQLAKFSPTDGAIAKLANEYLPLKIRDVNDIGGFTLVHRARMDIRNKRVSVEKVRKELKADALEYGRKVDAEAKRLTALLSPIEEHLESEEDSYNRAKEEIRNAARLKAEAEEQAKRDSEAAKIKAEQDAEAARIKAEREAEAARIKAEQDAENERLRIEREKLEAQRRAQEAELAEQRRLIAEQQAKAEAERAAKEKAERERQEAVEAKQRESQAKIDAERRAIEAEQKRLADIEAARIHAEEIAKAKAEAAAMAKKEAEFRIAREAAEAKAKAEQEEAERKREEALRPDREKLLAVADAVSNVIVPEVSEDARKARVKVLGVLSRAGQAIRKIAGEMTMDESDDGATT
jgi:septal ring factor EnvC (AmiA/AmiB activator)